MSSSPTEVIDRVSQRGPKMQLFEIVQVFAVAAVFIFMGARFSGGNPLIGQVFIWAAYVAMAAVIYAGLRRRGQSWAHFGLVFSRPSWSSARRAVWQSMVVLVATVAAFILGALVGASLFGLPEQADLSRYNPLHGNPLLLLAVLPMIWLASSVGEEIVFRGFLITRVAEISGGSKAAWRAAAGISAVAFGLAHYAWGPTGIIQTTMMGLLLGASYLLLNKNLWVVILTHAYMDTLLLVPML